jgi:site-specific DNA-methyltransferase (adenine-specific)
MSKYMKTEQAVVYHGNCLDELKNIPDNYVDAIVTDPPYGLGDSDPDYILSALKMWMDGDRSHIPAGKGFMGKQWDAFVPPPAVWDECFRVLKPGGYVLVFAGTRTVDLMGLSVRMAGFEIRDSLTWIYSQGFPKSLDISKAIDKLSGAKREVVGYTDPHDPRTAMARSIYGGDIQEGAGQGIPITAPATEDAKKWVGWGTALKPASEPIIMARKPLSEKTVAKNVIQWGTGGINIDGTRIGVAEGDEPVAGSRTATFGTQETVSGGDGSGGWAWSGKGRFPSNVFFGHADGCAQVGVAQDSYVINRTEEWTGFGQKERPDYESELQTVDVPIYECVDGCPVKEVGDASRFFYVAKANKQDRNEGLDGLSEKGKVFNGKNPESAGNAPGSVEDKFTTAPQKNFHPTVKPTSLMRQLVKMVAPENAIVLDPFAGSGSTGKASILEGRRFIGIEMTDEYLPIIQGRLEHAIRERKEK